MPRSAIKSISRKPEKFIPSTHKNDPDLSEDAVDILKRPLIFYVRKLSRDEQFRVRELLEYKDELKPEKGSKGLGDVLKFIWENNVVEVKNVVINENGVEVAHESLSGNEKNLLWNTEGMGREIDEAILFARGISMLDEVETKN